MGVDENDGNRSLLDRRSYLKATGIATLSGLATTGSATPAHDTLVVATDGTASYTVRTTGRVVRTSATGDATDSAADGTVTGEVTDGVAIYRITGALEATSVDGAATLRYDTQPTDPATELVVTSPTTVEYELTTTGAIERFSDGGNTAEGGETTIARNDDGTWTATGTTGDGYVDTFVVHGGVESFSPDDGDFSLLRDGDPVPATELGASADASGTAD